MTCKLSVLFCYGLLLGHCSVANGFLQPGTFLHFRVPHQLQHHPAPKVGIFRDEMAVVRTTPLFASFWENIIPTVGKDDNIQENPWAELFDESTRRPYYWNRQTGATTWAKPIELAPPPATVSTTPLKAVSPKAFAFSDARRSVAVGAYSAAGKSNGRLKENQDAYLIQTPLRGLNVNLFAILDGHGEFGAQATNFVARSLPDAVSRALQRTGSIAQSVADAFVEVDRALLQKLGDKATDSGATATIVLHRGDTLLVACVGDSRAVLGDVYGAAPQLLTTDHNPSQPRERARIEASGGMVAIYEGETELGFGGKGRVFLQGQPYPGLATARALGDQVRPLAFHLALGSLGNPLIGKTVGVTARPEFRTAAFSRSGQIMVMASDGLWDVVDPAAAIAACVPFAAAADATGAARLLVDRAAELWPVQRSAVTVDDITVVVAFF